MRKTRTAIKTGGNAPPRSWTRKATTGSLYVHIPFCTKKCGYCHFFVLPARRDLIESYLTALAEEWAIRKAYFTPGSTLYLGGGTPSVLEPRDLERIMSLFCGPFDEITIEANPENVTPEKIVSYRSLGINRISIGVQSLDGRELLLLERRTKAQEAIDAVRIAHKGGFENISIDLMFDIPGQSLASWKETLITAMSLPITHLSLYNLVLEEPSKFYYERKRIEPMQPTRETSCAMLEMACEMLEKKGLSRYEISAFARPGFESKHNSTYWEGGHFLGLGPSAFSYLHQTRFQNTLHFPTYISLVKKGIEPVHFEETLSEEKRLREGFVIALRLLKGTECPAFLEGEVKSLCEEGFLSQSGNVVRLEERGRLFYDTVASTLI